MPKIFEAAQFTPTKFSTAEEKAKFANHFIRFVTSGFPKSMFPKWFYNELRHCFGHIAHYDQNGFYNEWFTNDLSKSLFIKMTVQHPCYGDPTHTFSDVERALIVYLRKNDPLPSIQKKMDEDTKRSEVEQLHRLMDKYPDVVKVKKESQVKTCEFCRPTSNPFPSLGALEVHQQEAHGLIPS
jgi:hypothetical protein